MARLAVRRDDLRNLAIQSKNKCAFPGCDRSLLNAEGVYVAELCHIEAAELGGPRYNPAQTDEGRRAPANLLFLCHQHHKETDDEDEYTVARLQEIKRAHEALPKVVFNSELLLQRVEEVYREQVQIREILDVASKSQSLDNQFPIFGPELQDSWTPEAGRFYKTQTGSNTWFKYMMRDGWLHIEQQLEDGAIAYYEVNEAGSVRNSRMPYPINEYRVLIPDDLVLRRERVTPSLGTHAIKTILKWSKGFVIEEFEGDMFVGANCQTRITIDHCARTIRVLTDAEV